MYDDRREVKDPMFQFFLEQQRHQGAGFGIRSEICTLSREHHQAVLKQDWPGADELEDKMRAKWMALTQKNIMGRTHIKIAEMSATEMLEAFFVREVFWEIATNRTSSFNPSDFKKYAETWSEAFQLPKDSPIDYQWIIAGWLDAASEIYKMLVILINSRYYSDGDKLSIWESYCALLSAVHEAFALYELIASSVIDNGQGRVPWPMTFRGKMQKLQNHITETHERIQYYRERTADRVDREVLMSKIEAVIGLLSRK